MIGLPMLNNGMWVNFNGINRFIPLPLMKDISLYDKNNPSEISEKLKNYINDVVKKMISEIKVSSSTTGVSGKDGENGKDATPEQIDESVKKFILENLKIFIGAIKDNTEFKKEVCKECAKEFKNNLESELRSLKAELSELKKEYEEYSTLQKKELNKFNLKLVEIEK
jgi:hypothetical protein